MQDTTKRKRPTNLTLADDAKVLAHKMRKEDNRASLVNMLEHLIIQEAKRRGLVTKKQRA